MPGPSPPGIDINEYKTWGFLGIPYRKESTAGLGIRSKGMPIIWSLFPSLTTIDSSDSLLSILGEGGRELRSSETVVYRAERDRGCTGPAGENVPRHVSKEDRLVDEKAFPEGTRRPGKAPDRLRRSDRRDNRRRAVRHPPALQAHEPPMGGHGPAGERQAGPVRGGRRVCGV